VNNQKATNKPVLFKANEVGRACGTHERGEKIVQFLVGKPEGKRPLGRPRRRWEDEIRMDLRKIGLGGGGGLDSTVSV
jgi:hypothetical protein